MIEWIVLTWVATCWPASSFKCDGSDKFDKVFVSSSVVQFEQKWNSLSGKDRETAQIFIGKKARVEVVLNPSPAPSENFQRYKCLGDDVWLEYIGKGYYKCPKSGVISHNDRDGVPVL